MVGWQDDCLRMIDEFAHKSGKAFFPYSAQGKEIELENGVTIEEFNGWLVPEKEEKTFEKRWAEDDEKLFDDEELEFVWVYWEKKGDQYEPTFERFTN